MKKLFFFFLVLVSGVARGKLNDQQSMKCINADEPTKSVFQDLQAAYEMRLVTAKDFFQVMDKAPSCPQLRKDLKKLQASAVASFPQSKSAAHAPRKSAYDGDFGGNQDTGFDTGLKIPPPPPVPGADFSDDFSDFR